MSIEIGSISADQMEDFERAMLIPFLIDPASERTQNFKDLFDIQRMRAAFDGDQIVGTIGAHSFQMVVPGNVLPMAGTSIVTVLPTHRRQGVMRALMASHIDEIRGRGEPLAALWASESSIYGRFGFAPASEMAEMKIGRPYAKFVDSVDLEGSMRLVDCDEAKDVFPALYERVARARPGMYLRSEHWWWHRILSDPEFRRLGASSHRRVLHIRNGQPVGYGIFRIKDGDSGAVLQLIELIAIDSDAEKALWQFLFGVDLITSIAYWNLPIDCSLRWWLEQPRKMERKVEDQIWIRTIDVVACLNGRRYSSAASFVFSMQDDLCPWNDGIFRLTSDENGIGKCEPSIDEPELHLTPFALGATYLGGHRFTELGHAGLITGSGTALRRADAMFTANVSPWCQEVF